MAKEIDISKCRQELFGMLVCTFGYHEAEDEMLERCIEAIESGSMDGLKKDLVVFCAGDDKVLTVDNTRVSLILHRNKIWEYVKEKIREKNEI